MSSKIKLKYKKGDILYNISTKGLIKILKTTQHSYNIEYLGGYIMPSDLSFIYLEQNYKIDYIRKLKKL